MVGRTLEHLTVLYPGKVRYDLGERVTVALLSELATGDPGIVTTAGRAGRNRRSAR
ncbi:MAG: hypothetical protein ACREXX_16800 [Gammaproteobacteria bacterium]